MMEKIFCLDSFIESGASDCHMLMIFWLAGILSDAKRPSDDAKRLSDDAKRPSDDAKRPSDDAKRPSDDAKRPSDDAKRPSDDAKRPGVFWLAYTVNLQSKGFQRTASIFPME